MPNVVKEKIPPGRGVRRRLVTLGAKDGDAIDTADQVLLRVSIGWILCTVIVTMDACGYKCV